MPAQASSQVAQRLFAARLSLIGGLLILIGKFAAYTLTGSTAVLSDALESVVNVVAAALVLYSVVLASKPADHNHPYGHGKVELFSAGVEGTLIFVAGTLILVEAGREIWRGPELHRIDLGLALITGLTLGNAALGGYLIRVGRRTQSLALVADGHHLMTDVATSAGVMAGLLAVWLTGWVMLDPIVAIVLALNILRTGARLLRQAVAGLMDEADVGLLEQIVTALQSSREPGWIDVHSLRAWRSGAVNHIDMHVVVPRYLDVEQLHRVDGRIHAVALPPVGGGDAIVHFDPCRPRHCPGCLVEKCPVRSSQPVQREALTLSRATRADELLETGQPLPPPPAVGVRTSGPP